jgi:polysaccharide biosynthesis/export protein
MINFQFRSFSFLFLFCVCIVSCVSSRKLTEKAVYFKGISDSMLKAAPVEYEPIIQKGDILSVSVITTNERSSRFFNSVSPGTISGGEAVSANASQGYLVNEHGSITLPLIGNVRAAGLTRLALTDSVRVGLKKYIDSAIVSIRLMNYRITVLGEVVKPGTFSIPSERVSVLDAIGLAGDLTIYGKRENIRVIRNTDGMRQTAVLNLNKGDIFGSPFFYLRQNDIVYVEMNDRKIPNTDQANIRNISIALGIVSALGVIISTINVLR